MDDTISRKTAVQGVRELFSMGDCYCDELSIVGMLNQLSSARQKNGKWIKQLNGVFTNSYKCSECGRIVWGATECDVVKDYPYCKCGADMREAEDNEH